MLHIITRAYRFDLLKPMFDSLPKVDDIHWHISKSKHREDIVYDFLKSPNITIYNVDCLDTDRTTKTNHVFDHIKDGYFCLLDDDTIFHHSMYDAYKICESHKFIGMVMGNQLNEDNTVRLIAQEPTAGKVDTGQCLAHFNCLSEVKWSHKDTRARDFIFWNDVYHFYNKLCIFMNKPISWYNKSVKRVLLLLYKASDDHIKRLQLIAPSWTIFSTTDFEEAKKWMGEAEIVMGNHNLCETLPYQKRLVLLQTSSSGVDKILKSSREYLKTVNISNTRGIYTREIAEHTIGLLFTMHRELHLLRDAQRKHEWRRSENLSTLNNKNVLILGYGNLGKHIGDKLKIFGMNIFGVNTKTYSFDNVHWKDLLHKMDFVILALPDTPQTDNILSKKELDKLSSSAIVINVGRAKAIDQKYLFSLLKTKRIKGAALDVFSEEPLPKDHSAWDITNLFISPHTARSKETDHYKYQDFFELNFKYYVKENKVYNVIDKTKGY